MVPFQLVLRLFEKNHFLLHVFSGGSLEGADVGTLLFYCGEEHNYILAGNKGVLTNYRRERVS